MSTKTLAQDFDRGMVPMTLDCGRDDCNYRLRHFHYHCVICGRQVNEDEMSRDHHPCCRVEHTWINEGMREYEKALWGHNPFLEE